MPVDGHIEPEDEGTGNESSGQDDDVRVVSDESEEAAVEYYNALEEDPDRDELGEAPTAQSGSPSSLDEGTVVPDPNYRTESMVSEQTTAPLGDAPHAVQPKLRRFSIRKLFRTSS